MLIMFILNIEYKNKKPLNIDWFRIIFISYLPFYLVIELHSLAFLKNSVNICL